MTKLYEVVYAPKAEEQLAVLYRYIASAASPEIAQRYTSEIVVKCDALDKFPMRGAPRDDLRPGLRVLSFRHRVTIAYRIKANVVTILELFYPGQDFEKLVADD